MVCGFLIRGAKKLLVMPSSNGQSVVHFWAGRGYPVGWLFTPGRNREPKPWLPYAIDNGKFGVYLDGREWEKEKFLTTLRHFQKQEIKPRWAAVPDVVANKEETLKAWAKWFPRLSKEFSFDWAFVAQDGMTPCDVPTGADVVFIGGSKAWKWKNAKLFSESFPRVHIGGVNSTHYLNYSKSLGVESVDGSGWFRGPKMIQRLENWFRGQAGEISTPVQLEFFK